MVKFNMSEKILDAKGKEINIPIDVKRKLVLAAQKKDIAITPCKEHFSIHNNKLIFWYNDKNCSTKIVSTKLNA